MTTLGVLTHADEIGETRVGVEARWGLFSAAMTREPLDMISQAVASQPHSEEGSDV
jgi:hypothetical protein